MWKVSMRYWMSSFIVVYSVIVCPDVLTFAFLYIQKKKRHVLVVYLFHGVTCRQATLHVPVRWKNCQLSSQVFDMTSSALPKHQKHFPGLWYCRSRVSFCNITYVVPQPPNVWTHRATHSLHIPKQQHTVYRCSWIWTCRSETCRAVKHIVNKYSTVTEVVYLVGLHT